MATEEARSLYLFLLLYDFPPWLDSVSISNNVNIFTRLCKLQMSVKSHLFGTQPTRVLLIEMSLTVDLNLFVTREWDSF